MFSLLANTATTQKLLLEPVEERTVPLNREDYYSQEDVESLGTQQSLPAIAVQKASPSITPFIHSQNESPGRYTNQPDVPRTYTFHDKRNVRTPRVVRLKSRPARQVA